MRDIKIQGLFWWVDVTQGHSLTWNLWCRHCVTALVDPWRSGTHTKKRRTSPIGSRCRMTDVELLLSPRSRFAISKVTLFQTTELRLLRTLMIWFGRISPCASVLDQGWCELTCPTVSDGPRNLSICGPHHNKRSNTSDVMSILQDFIALQCFRIVLPRSWIRSQLSRVRCTVAHLMQADGIAKCLWFCTGNVWTGYGRVHMARKWFFPALRVAVQSIPI